MANILQRLIVIFFLLFCLGFGPPIIQMMGVLSEDFLSYTETDPNGRITVTSNKVSWSGLTRNEDAYVYKDKTANYFSGDFEHRFIANITSMDDGGVVGCWAMINSIDDYAGLKSANEDAFRLSMYRSGASYRFILTELDGGSEYEDPWISAATGTDYYITVKRDEAVGTYGTIYAYIRTGSHAGTLQDTLTVTLNTSKKDFRYIFVCLSSNTATAQTATGYTQDLELK